MVYKECAPPTACWSTDRRYDRPGASKLSYDHSLRLSSFRDLCQLMAGTVFANMYVSMVAQRI